ncbi:MAG: hypothetical protein ACXVOI_06295 [Tumebacillaceae bacterium]
MTTQKVEIDHATHRKLAVDNFNYTWDLMEKTERTQLEDDTMIHAAHTSRYHWGHVGTPLNFARGEWQISRVYSVLKRAEPALHHANRCLDWCKEHDLGNFDLAYAYEALARGYAVQGNVAERVRNIELAEQVGEKIADEASKKMLFDDLKTLV